MEPTQVLKSGPIASRSEVFVPGLACLSSIRMGLMEIAAAATPHPHETTARTTVLDEDEAKTLGWYIGVRGGAENDICRPAVDT